MGIFFTQRRREKRRKAPYQPEILKQVATGATDQVRRLKSYCMLNGISLRLGDLARDTAISMIGLRAAAPGFHALAHEHSHLRS